MKYLKSHEVRQKFIDFFVEKEHGIEPSASLVPKDDPTLLWINSGVATLKKYFDGRVVPDNPRITNAQKAIRTNDIENVGFTARHHTFFEMLGNFSIGDYFKKDAIKWAWEFLTSEKWLGFEKEKLSVTIHPEDDEAYDIWLNDIRLPEERIIRLEENFWDIGIGPSGPNTEIFYDRGEAFGNNPSDPELYPGGENERYLEVWNLVFSQFNHNEDGTYTPLPNKNIDTGMGLERLVSIIQDVATNFDTDLFIPIIKKIETYTEKRYGKTDEDDTAFRVIADHIRTASFAIGDGVLPSNEGRGYVIRRLIRRAVRFAKQLGIEQEFMYQLVSVVGDIMKEFYPDVAEKHEQIEKIIKVEEEKFHKTLYDGLQLLNDIIESEKQEENSIFPGVEAFKLYDTYGFPVELTEEYVREERFTLDIDGFHKEMKKQKERAKSARKDVSSMQTQSKVLRDLDVKSEFVGYDTFNVDTKVVAIIKDGVLVDKAEDGDNVALFLEQTPFYAESGGQVADTGIIGNAKVSIKVNNVQKAPLGQHTHYVTITGGIIHVGDDVGAEIAKSDRQYTVKNHTATHLLHQALRDVLGEHVNQAGSLVNPSRLRFDFSHFHALTIEEIEKIEVIVNEKIWDMIDVSIVTKNIDDAKAMGARALFGEKYGDIVRVVQVGDYSIELCGGCHVKNTSDIGLFKISHETGVGAGVRRIEAKTSKYAYDMIQNRLDILQSASTHLKTDEEKIIGRINTLQDSIKSLQKENESLQAKLAHNEADSLTDDIVNIKEIPVLAKQVKAKDMNQLRQMVDDLKEKQDAIVIVLAAVNDGKVQIATGITKNLNDKGLHAGKLIKEVATICGGGGGGRPDMAQAGGKEPDKVEEALAYVWTYIESQV